MKLMITLIAAAFFIFGCEKSKPTNLNIQKIKTENTSALRTLSESEKSNDFDQLIGLFKSYYGPYQFKESFLGLDINQIGQNLKQAALQAKTDEEFAGFVMKFGASLKDGHVQIQVKNTSSGIQRYKIPIVITPLEGKAIIADIPKDLISYSGLNIGDEVLAVDGQSPFEYMKTATKYRSLATDLSNQHSILYTFFRPSYMTDIKPTKASASVKAVKSSGESVETEIPWTLEKYAAGTDTVLKPAGLDFSVAYAHDYNQVIENHRMQMGQVDPIFLTPAVQNQFKFIKVYPSSDYRKKYGLAETETPPIYAALYKYNQKTILLVRSATYSPSDFKPAVYMKAYMALMDQYQDLADVLVLDQTHNPGGSYCSDFYNLFAKEGDVQTVEKVRADRKWILDFLNTDPASLQTLNPYDAKISLNWSAAVEKAYDENQFLSEALPFFTGFTHVTAYDFRWSKPMLVLIDELAGSCGDIFPMLVKANHRATLFGQTTMGLGGNVEEVGTLSHSQISVRMTRGLFSPYKAEGNYVATDFVENQGVTPDIFYSHTVKDFRSGFTNYVKTFSDAAIAQIK